MTQQHIPMNQEVIKAAEDISLADLLESPSFSVWIVSALSNGGRYFASIEGTDSRQDKELRFEIYELFNTIPHQDRRDVFATVHKLVRTGNP